MPVYTLVAIRWDSKRTMNKFVECKLPLLLLSLVLLLIFFLFSFSFFFNQQFTRDKVHRRTVRLLETINSSRIRFLFYVYLFLFLFFFFLVSSSHRHRTTQGNPSNYGNLLYNLLSLYGGSKRSRSRGDDTRMREVLQ